MAKRGNRCPWCSKLSALLLACLPVFARAIESSHPDARLTPHDKLADVLFLDESQGWAVGTRGLILYSGDGGQTWQRKESGTGEALFSVWFQGARGWISGSAGVVLRTDNGGKDWRLQKSGTRAALFRVQFVTESKGFAVGSFGTALRSENGGTDWESMNLPWELLIKEVIEEKGVMEPHLYDVFFATADLGWIVGEFGLVLHTADGGKSWSRQRVPTSSALFRVFFSGKDRGWSVGQNGLLLATMDGGKRWEKIDTPVAEGLFNISVQGDLGLIVGERGTILTSHDGGVSWRSREEDTFAATSWFSAVSPVGGNRFVLAGDRGTIHVIELDDAQNVR